MRLNPQITIVQDSFAGPGETIEANVSVYNRPDYHGKPEIDGLTEITPVIVCSRSPAGVMPFHVMVSAHETTADAGKPFKDLHFEWDFGDPSGTETFVDHWTGNTVNANTGQQGPIASYVYRTPGTYTITLTAKGKDENGNLITATTTSIKTVGYYHVFVSNATGGTFTLTVNGETTSAIAYDATTATILAALHALPSLDASNCKSNYNGTFEFVGELAGTTITFTGDFSALTGVTGSAQVRANIASATESQVTVSDYTGWTAQYFDSNYDGSAGASDGTITRPYTAWSNLATFIVTAGNFTNRVAYLKAGSTFTMTGNALYAAEHRGLRVISYGSGAKPIIVAGSYQFTFEQARGSAAQPTGRHCGDFVFHNLDIQDKTGTSPFWYSYASNNDSANYIAIMWQHIAIDSCDFEHVSVSNDGYMSSMQTTTGRGIGLAGVYFWNTNSTKGSSEKHSIFGAPDRWLSVVGGLITGGSGSLGLDHHIYSNVKALQLFRWIEFGPGTLNFCLNVNAANDAGAVPYFVADGCDITGTQSGIDFSNSLNDESLSGHIDYAVVQFNKIHCGQAGTQNIGVYGSNIHELVIRHSDLWENRGNTMQLLDNTTALNLDVYGCNIFNGAIRNGGSNQQLYLVNNNFYSDSTYRIINLYGSPTLYSNNNVFYAPSAVSPFVESGSTAVSWASWQAAGRDPDSTYESPVFADPANGVFIDNPEVGVQWPTGWTSHEVYLSGSWQAYTNGELLSLGTSIDAGVTIPFRAVSGGSYGTAYVNAITESATLQSLSESGFDTIGGPFANWQNLPLMGVG